MSERPARWLVAVDGSPAAAAALRWAIDGARRAGAELLALHVIEPRPPSMAPAAGLQVAGAAQVGPGPDALNSAAEESFRGRWTAPLAKSGVPHRLLLAEGRAGPSVLQAARDEQVALIAVGGRRSRKVPSTLPELMAGSVNAYLMQHAPCPVVIVPGPSARGRTAEERAAPTGPGLRHRRPRERHRKPST